MLAKLFAKRQLVFEWKIEASNVEAEWACPCKLRTYAESQKNILGPPGEGNRLSFGGSDGKGIHASQCE
jgi:hypothetical protein